jgi:hypothetical protein
MESAMKRSRMQETVTSSETDGRVERSSTASSRCWWLIAVDWRWAALIVAEDRTGARRGAERRY